MNFGPVLKLVKKNKKKKRTHDNLNKFEDDVVSKTCDFNVIFLIYGQFG